MCQDRQIRGLEGRANRYPGQWLETRAGRWQEKSGGRGGRGLALAGNSEDPLPNGRRARTNGLSQTPGEFLVNKETKTTNP